MPPGYAYGPVPSRRFGLSLGVDVVPRKICPYDCIYCQVGRTTRRSLERAEFHPLGEVLADVERALAEGPRPEVLTLAGSGEPSLYARLGELVAGLRRLTDLPLVLLTNGALLWRDDVRADALGFDVLAPSLDAPDAETFERINRPHPGLRFEQVVEGLGRLAELRPGRLRLEVMLVPGLNDDPASLDRLAALVAGWPLGSIDLNTPVRPAPGRAARPCPAEVMAEAAARLGPRARVVADYSGPRAAGRDSRQAEAEVLGLLARRPCTAADLGNSLGLEAVEVSRVLDALRARGRVVVRRMAGRDYFYPAEAG